jgi:hypothetical protein
MLESDIAKNILLDRTCDTCKHIEYESNNIEICHGGSCITKDRTCLLWEKYQAMDGIFENFMKHRGW